MDKTHLLAAAITALALIPILIYTYDTSDPAGYLSAISIIILAIGIYLMFKSDNKETTS